MRGAVTNFLSGVVLGIFILSGCALQDRRSRQTQTECVWNDDQQYTFLAKWSVTPIPVALQLGMFTDAAETAAIRGAIETWNSFFQRSMGTVAFDYLDGGDLRFSAAPYPDNLQDLNFVRSGRFVDSIVIYKKTSWPDNDSGVIAETSSYYTSGRSYNTFASAAISLNYNDYFSEGKQRPDLRTIVLHELGHLLGLRHSCENGARVSPTGVLEFPSCTGNPSYEAAVMRPQFGFISYWTGIQVRSLTENDEGRANCLYKN